MIGNSIDGQGTFLGVPTPTSPTGHGVLLDYENTNSVVQTLFVQDNNIINCKGEGFIVLSGGSTVLDASFTHNFIAHNFDNGLTIDQASIGATRVTLTNNTIINNVSSMAPDIGAAGASAGVALFSDDGNLVGVLNNNVISNNGQDGHANPAIGSASAVSGIVAQTDFSARWGWRSLAIRSTTTGIMRYN